MTNVPRFDERLERVLDIQAAAAGETVDDYVARAVADRLVAGMVELRDPELGPLLEHLTTLGLSLSPQASAASEDVTTVNDPDRLRALRDTGLLDSPREDAFDRVTAMAVEALAVPAAAISLVDERRQFFKSAIGVPTELDEVRETSLDRSICQYAVTSGEPLIVEDARVHPLLKDHPAVTERFLVAYAGIPLKDSDGHAIGTLCVWDNQPRQWTTGHLQTLGDLAQILHERIWGDSGNGDRN